MVFLLSGKSKFSLFNFDATLALRLLSELQREFDHPLNVAFISTLRQPLIQSIDALYGKMHCGAMESQT